MTKTEERPQWSWQGAAALVIAVSIGGGWLAGIVVAALSSDAPTGLDRELAQLLNGIGQVLAGALGTFLGFAAGTAHTPTPTDPPLTSAVPPGTVPPDRFPDPPADVSGA